MKLKEMYYFILNTCMYVCMYVCMYALTTKLLTVKFNLLYILRFCNSLFFNHQQNTLIKLMEIENVFTIYIYRYIYVYIFGGGGAAAQRGS
jgi:hypothetical protein